MLRLEEIRDARFHQARKGYMPEEVDGLIEKAVATMEELEREKVADKQKIEELERELTVFRDREHKVGEALVVAQRQADLVVAEAEKRAEHILADARALAQEITIRAEQNASERKITMDALSREAVAFKRRLLSLYQEQMGVIAAMPDDFVTKIEVPAEENSAAEATAAEVNATTETADKPEEGTLPSLFFADDVAEDDHKSERFTELQFGDDYAADTERGLFRKKK